MKLAFMLFLMVAIVFTPNIWAFLRRVWRLPLLPELSKHWTDICRVYSLNSCNDFTSCCKTRFPKDACEAAGGMLEYPVCNYWLGATFDPKRDGNCQCFQKFLKEDFKDQCKSLEEQKSCEAFVDCCKNADQGDCERFEAAEIEMPACDRLEGKAFFYNDSECRCVFDSPNTTVLRKNWPVKVRPKIKPLPPLATPNGTANSGNKNDNVLHWWNRTGFPTIEKVIAVAMAWVIFQTLPGPIVE